MSDGCPSFSRYKDLYQNVSTTVLQKLLSIIFDCSSAEGFVGVLEEQPQLIANQMSKLWGVSGTAFAVCWSDELLLQVIVQNFSHIVPPKSRPSKQIIFFEVFHSILQIFSTIKNNKNQITYLRKSRLFQETYPFK